MSVPPFELLSKPLLSRSTVNRQEPLLGDDEQRAKLWPEGRLLVIDRPGTVPVRGFGRELAYRRAGDTADTPPDNAVLVGEEGGVGYWAMRIDRAYLPETPARRVWDAPALTEDEQWLDLRSLGALLSARDAGVFTTAMAVLNWQRSRFCARCGSQVRLVRSGWASRCTQCDHEEYPRTDPAVICLVHDEVGVNGEHVLLARQPSWPERRYSVLAGFVEAGESLEDCVVREIAEEVGVDVRNVRYLGNQPWPFPRSLMIGFTAVADRSAPLRLADGEIAEAHWVHRDRVRAAMAGDASADGLGLPGGISIAHAMVEAWAATEAGA